MTFSEKLKRMRDALTAIDGLTVYHYFRPQMQAPFCVWAEDGESESQWGNNHMLEQVLSGTVDYYTHDEYDGVIDLIQDALNSIETCGWNLESVQYEDETNLVHFEWFWRIA